jgi:hypothetical protein
MGVTFVTPGRPACYLALILREMILQVPFRAAAGTPQMTTRSAFGTDRNVTLSCSPR